MQASIWLKYLFGQADAIRKVAGSRASLWTGIALVLLTSIARNYDQTHFSENPILWIFGSLLFSLVSGSWIYAVVYAICARKEMTAPGEPKPTEDGGWLSFMGLFWMTAPVAWLYAIPVERFMDSISAAWANVALLSVVSLWRVVLMTRVMQVTTRAPFLIALVWVLFSASIEVLVVFFFGGGFSKALIAGMGGMRNSPEEEVLLGAMGAAFGAAFWIAPVTFLLALFWRPRILLVPLPCPKPDSMPWLALLMAATFWLVIAIQPQRELVKNVAVERLMTAGQAREALDLVAAHQPGDFAPTRPLPPKSFERSVFTELPACFGVIKNSDPAWVQAMMIGKLDEMVSHLRYPWSRRRVASTQPRFNQVNEALSGLRRFGPDADGILMILDGLDEIPTGGEWRKANTIFTEAIWKTVIDPQMRHGHRSSTEGEQQADWMTLSNRLYRLGLTNVSIKITNTLPGMVDSAHP